jgi:hypothetical protein
LVSVVSGVSARRALAANLLLLGFLGAFAWLEASLPNAYYRSVQEDQALEWASFWSFFVAAGVFAVAAWRQRRTTGEVIECAMGFGFLFAAIANAERFSGGRGGSSPSRVAGLLALIVALAFSTAWWSQNRQSGDPANLELAKAEAAALRDDLIQISEARNEPSITNCGLHKRLYTVVQTKKRAQPFVEGSFTGLVERGLPEARAEFFLDPWNSPYWIRDRCDTEKGRRVVFVYSFGPNRSRDSSRWEILGDDIGEYALVEP